jgi:OTU domain-containing protein 3
MLYFGMIYSRSYHDGEHYNSVRLKDDPGDGPARSIVIQVLIRILIIFLKLMLRVKSSSYLLINSSLWKADADLSAPSHQTKDRASQPYAQAGEKTFQPGSVKVVMAGSGCENREKVEQVQLLSCLTDISV